MSASEIDVARLMAASAVPGLALAVVESGAISRVAAGGVRHATTREPVTERTVFEAASLSKPVFAYAVAQLADAGLLPLDEPLARHVPDYVPGDPRAAAITVRHVLAHMPFPKLTLQRAQRLMTDDGVLFVSTPNIDTYVWKYLDFADRNPYWYEIEHYHICSRTRLYALLREFGFAVVDYQINERYRTDMQVIARKRPNTQAGFA